MEKHIHLVAILNIVYESVTLLIAVILFIVSAMFGFIMEHVSRWGEMRPHEIPPELMELIPVILFFVGVVIAIVSCVGIIGAVGVLRQKDWGRLITLVVSFVNLLRVPIGTALGIYSIWALMNDETIRLFNPPPTVSAPPNPPQG